MALIKCIECGKMVSEYAAACPNCGCPIDIILKKAKTNSVKKEEQQRQLIGSASSKAGKEVNTKNLVNYRSLCKIPEDVVAQAGETKTGVKASSNMPMPNPTMPIAKDESISKKGVSLSKKYATANVGDYIKFGRYKQEDQTPQDIEWRVLAKEGSKMLLISRYGLDRQRYHQTRESVTWESCTLRTWLNTDFIKSAFNLSEYGMIVRSHIKAAGNPKFKTKAGSDTWDKVFLLSIEEVENYFRSEKDMICQATEYAKRQGANCSWGNCWWWLRSPGKEQHCAAFVRAYSSGGIEFWGCDVIDSITTVRPALWIDLEA